MIEKIRNGVTVVLVLLLVPLFLTGLFAFFWGFYGFTVESFSGEGSSPEPTWAILWEIYFLLFFVWDVIYLFLWTMKNLMK